ncbi:alpha/beta hydrolase, partial [Pseudomonas sp. BGM005]|nr:alpha/beta hydrolase [Pseudomonas sp. BG5]
VQAQRGFVTADDAKEFARRLPHADVISVDATHNVQETAPVELSALIAASASAL